MELLASRTMIVRRLVTVFILYFTTSEAAFNCSDPPVFFNFDINTCCRVPQINLGNTPQKCAAEINSNKLYVPAYSHLCYPECIYRESGILQNGEIQLPKVLEFLENSVTSDDRGIVPIIMQSFENCIKYFKGHMDAIKVQMYASLPSVGCSPYSSMVWGCVNADTFTNCPQKMWKDDYRCNLMLNFANECNPLPHVPLPLY